MPFINLTIKRSKMKKLKYLFNQNEFHFLVFFVFFLFYLLPVISDFGAGKPGIIFLFYNILLLIQIIILFFISKSLDYSSYKKNENDKS